jgi:lipopolysaccharide transport system permease protein
MPALDHLRATIPSALVRNRQLLVQLVVREIASRYRGSALGTLWALLTPLLMLGVFTFVFTTAFQARWGTAVADRSNFALMLFPGLVLYGMFSEVLTRAPGLIVANPSYVRKIVFPLEILPAVAVGSALFQALVGFLVVLVFRVALTGSFPWTVIWLPVVLAPFVVVLLGIGWLLSALGVYLRDLAQVTGVLATVLMFLSPVFYPAEALPPEWRPLLQLSPLTEILDQTRRTLVAGTAPDPARLFVYAALAIAFAAASLYLFQRSRKGFADVL